jgi:hypothetical protein
MLFPSFFIYKIFDKSYDDLGFIKERKILHEMVYARI